MDGIHDLGGMEGLGAVDVDAPPFTHDWERRQWALSKNLAVPAGTIDFWRHGIERMDPKTYLSVPYFEKWCLNDLTHFILAGEFTLAEATSGTTKRPGPRAEVRNLEVQRHRLSSNEVRFDRPAQTEAVFAVGDTVTTQRHGHSGHTRLPAYARGATGTITHHHGAHLYPDDGAHGIETAHHLYTVEFTAPELWGDNANPNDTVLLDLWEPYFARP